VLRGLLKALVWIFVLAVVAVAALVVTGLQRDPLVTEFTPPTSAEVIEARAFVQRLRETIDPANPSAETFTTDAGEMNSVIKLGARIFPGFRGAVETGVEGVLVRTSLPFEIAGITRWINLSGLVPAFTGRVSVEDLRFGPVPLPGDAMLEIGRRGANLVVGNAFGDTVLGSARAMAVSGDDMTFVMQMDGVGSNGIMRGLFGSMRGSEMPMQDDIMWYYRAIRTALDDGALPTEGSYLPYVRFTLALAQDGVERDGAVNAYTSAIFGLSLACGARDFGLIVGGITDGTAIRRESWEKDCSALLFNERIDSRRHFTTAAALQAASNRGFAVSVGEFKELYDSVKSGGFDFTDIAANNSGIRMSNTFMAADPATWPDLIARIETENDVIIPYDGIPQIMSEEDFTATFGNVESPAYLAQLAEIEARIDRLPIHR